MSVNRSGYYKWLKRKDNPNRYEQDRIILTELLLEQHKKHKTKGYHYLANLVRNETGWMFSDNLAHKCCKFAGIRSKTNRVRKYAGKEHIKFPNIIRGNWNTTRPLEIVVSDMTCFRHKGSRWEWTYILDVYNNEIIASSVTNKIGSSLPYYDCLNMLIEKTNKHYTNIKRSMSRAGTPTDNPIIESLNGWIKEEMKIDFNLKSAEDIPSFIENYVYYFNNERLSYKFNYKTPVQYRIEQGFG